MRFLFPFFTISILFASCVGTDYIDDPTIAERVVISPRIDSLKVGQSVQFSAAYFNEFGMEEQVAVAWQSTAPNIVSIDQNGKATGLAGGPAKIIAKAGNAADTLVLNTTGVTNSTTLRTGTFQNAGSHYQVAGNTKLEKLPNGSLRLSFENNFSASAGPSLYVLLANHTNGSYTVTPGGNAVNGTSAQITSTKLTSFSGAMTFNVPAGIGIDDYKYVVLYCTLGPVFGYATLSN
jgi:hypothetical protein